MNIKTNKSDLLKALMTAIKVVPSKTTLPILENFLLKADGSGLSITASDQTITVTSKCSATGEGEACVPAKTLVDLVKTLPDNAIDISSDGNLMRIDWGIGHCEIPVFPVADYPSIGETPDSAPVVVKCDELKDAISICVPCTASDEMRPILSGLYFNPIDGVYEVASSDSHCMIVAKLTATGDRPFLMHKNAANVIRDNIGDGEVEIRINDSTIYVTSDNFTLSVKKIEGRFPNYRSVIPTNNTNILDIDTDSFISSIKRVSTCASKTSNVVKLKMSVLGGCEAEAQDLSFSVSAREVVGGCSFDGEDMSIGMKSSILLQIVKSFKSESVRMKFSSSNRAVLVESDEEDTMAIIMPVQVA